MLLVGVALAAFGGIVNLGAVVGGLALLAGAILVGTALLRVCPLYRLVGANTSGTR